MYDVRACTLLTRDRSFTGERRSFIGEIGHSLVFFTLTYFNMNLTNKTNNKLNLIVNIERMNIILSNEKKIRSKHYIYNEIRRY